MKLFYRKHYRIIKPAATGVLSLILVGLILLSPEFQRLFVKTADAAQTEETVAQTSSEASAGDVSDADQTADSAEDAASGDSGTAGSETETVQQDNAQMLAGEDSWMLALINRDHPLDASYTPASLTQIDDSHSVDSRIADALLKMLNDASAQGLDMYVISGYRSYDYQTQLFNDGVSQRMGQGLTEAEAYSETARNVAVPGTSEHASGLAVDIVSAGYTQLDEGQARTAEQQWLMEHCWEYGFILRYPEGTEEITGIVYEPWHYRYVGVETAKEITEQNVTLEEYLGQSRS